MLENEYAPSPELSIFKYETNKFYGSPALGGPTPTPRNFTPSSLSHTKSYPLALLNSTAKDVPLKSGHIRMFLTPSCPAFGRYTNGIDIDVSRHRLTAEDVNAFRKQFADIYAEHAQRRRAFEKEHNQRNFKLCPSSFFNTASGGNIMSGNYMNASEDSSDTLDMSISNDSYATTEIAERTFDILNVQSPAGDMSPVLLVSPMRQSGLSTHISQSQSQPELPLVRQQEQQQEQQQQQQLQAPIKSQLRMSQASLMSFDAPIADSSYEIGASSNNVGTAGKTSMSKSTRSVADAGGTYSKQDCDIDSADDYIEDDDDDDFSSNGAISDDSDDDGESLFGEDNIVYDEDDLESSDNDDGDFQTRWKHALDEVRSLDCHENDDAWTQRYDNLARVTSDFADIARLYAHVIVTEMGMRNKGDRTIPPTHMGGVAGGDKYMVIKQIMFKCPKTKSNKDDFGFSK